MSLRTSLWKVCSEEVVFGGVWANIMCVDWADGDTNVADSNAQHLWEEQWDDDDDTDENFSAQLK